MTLSLKDARASALRLLKKYGRTDEHARTPVLRDLAEALVEARAHFTRADGSPDWKGRSYAYRVWVRDLYDAAGVRKEEQATLQAAVRYHVGSVLREHLDDDTLAEYGLIPRSPKQRSADRRQNRSAVLAALTSKDLQGGALLSITAAWTVLSKVQPAALDELDGHALEVAQATLTDLERKTRQLRAQVREPRPV